MTRWLFLLAPLIVWLIHFTGVYVIASVADVAGDAASPGARLAAGVFTTVCAAASGGLLWLAVALGRQRRAREPLTGFIISLAGLGALIALVGVLWQGLPTLIGY